MNKQNIILNSNFIDYPIISTMETEMVINQLSGENKKGILINIFQKEDEKEHMNFLEKVLSAVKLNITEDVLVLATKTEQRYNFSNLAQAVSIHQSIFFGQPPTMVGLNIQIKTYAPLNIMEKQLLFADKLSDIQQNQALKKSLWQSLQKMFKV